MADDTSIVRDRFNEEMSRAVGISKALSLAQKSNVWKAIAESLDSIRKKGNLMGQSKGLTQTEVDQSIKSYARRFGEEG